MTVTTTASSSTIETPVATPAADPVATGEDRRVEEDLLVEDVSIDGMCGVY
jgi:mycofactocin precursor